MSRTLNAALIAAFLLTPAIARAQQDPPRTKELKDADKFIAAAMLTSDSAERKTRLTRALNPLQLAMAKNPQNARVWFAAGQVYAGLGDFARADSAFDKAEQLYAPLASDIADERLKAWVAAFTASNALMDANKYPEAAEQLRLAEVLYAGRPESKINLGAIYSNLNEVAKAEDAFRSVITLVKNTPAENITAEEKPQWKRFNEIATINLAQMIGARGVKAFEAEDYDVAVAAFREAHQLNPLSRDFAYNLAQSFYAKARQLEARRAAAKGDEAKELADQIVASYAEMEPLVVKARASDPNNEDLFLLQMRSYKVRGDLSADPKVKADFNKRASDLVTQHASLEAEVLDFAVGTTAPGEGFVKGSLRNIKLKPGTPVKVRVALIGMDGTEVGGQEIQMNAPAADQSAPFETQVKLTGDIAAWKYEIVK